MNLVPHSVSLFFSLPGALLAQEAKLSVSDLPKAIDAYLAPLIKEDKFSGAVLVAKDGKPVFRKAAGFAHLGHKTPNNIDTKFNLASMGKMLTAVAVAQLVESGKLSFDRPIGTYAPDLPEKDMKEKVTLHHLLNHTSGVQDIFTEEFFNGPRDKYRELKDYLPLFINKPLAFEPGSKSQYSNGAFCLAGYLVEKASGVSYWDYVRKHIFEPAGMKDSGPFEMDIDTPNLAYGYSNDSPEGLHKDGRLRNNLFTHSIKGTPAGGSFSTVGDLLRFSEGLKAGKLLGKAGFENLVTPHGTLGTNATYGYGFFIRELNGDKIVGHSGGFLGISSRMDVYLKSGWTVIVLSNYDRIADPVAARIRKMLLEELKK
jgi:D-alanyl-D-alanine carboxypeptidase